MKLTGKFFWCSLMTWCLFLLSFAGQTSAVAQEIHYVNSLGMEFVLIAPGKFIKGSPETEANRGPGEVQYEVVISKAFYLQTTEVTLGQWWALMGKQLFGRRKGASDMPVTKVSWHDCQKFIKKLNAMNQGIYRLPTEAEWEYACRAGSMTAYSWGDTIDCSKAVYSNSSMKDDSCTLYLKTLRIDPDGPAPVKKFLPNAWGLFDMHGNVWEWCQDSYHEDCLSAGSKDPVVRKKRMEKVKRGGSWFGKGYACRSANRAYAHASSRLQTSGFRVVRIKP